MQNIEIKYRINDVGLVRELLSKNPEVQFRSRFFQKDIYFNAGEGRFKLRLQENAQPCLIKYLRPDLAAARISDYTITPVSNVERTIRELEQKYGILAEVEKQRHLYMFRNVRLHLDEVADIGWFFELESVISEEHLEKAARENLEQILSAVKNALGEAQATGYLNLLLKNRENLS